MPTQNESFYAIQLPCFMDPRRARLASSLHSGPLLAYTRKEAVRIKRDFIASGFRQARVVKVTATFRWPSRPRALASASTKSNST